MNFSRTCAGSTASRTACSDGDIAVKAPFSCRASKTGRTDAAGAANLRQLSSVGRTC